MSEPAIHRLRDRRPLPRQPGRPAGAARRADRGAGHALRPRRAGQDRVRLRRLGRGGLRRGRVTLVRARLCRDLRRARLRRARGAAVCGGAAHPGHEHRALAGDPPARRRPTRTTHARLRPAGRADLRRRLPGRRRRRSPTSRSAPARPRSSSGRCWARRTPTPCWWGGGTASARWRRSSARRSARIPPRRGGMAGADIRGRFDDLGECLDELERCGNMVQSEQHPGDEGPIGLEGLFDERDYEARLVLPLPRVWPRRVAAGLGLWPSSRRWLRCSLRGAPLRPRSRSDSRPVAVSAGSEPRHRQPTRHPAHHRARIHRRRAFAPRRPLPEQSRPASPRQRPRPAAG